VRERDEAEAAAFLLADSRLAVAEAAFAMQFSPHTVRDVTSIDSQTFTLTLS
jgi:hypothetical protein